VHNGSTRCKSDVVRSNKHVDKTTGNEDIHQYSELENTNSERGAVSAQEDHSSDMTRPSQLGAVSSRCVVG